MQTTFLRAMTPAVAAMSPLEFHSQGLRYERARERILMALGRQDDATVAGYHARRHERELASLS